MVDKLVEECIENINEVKIASENEHKNKFSSCILYTCCFQYSLQSTSKSTVKKELVLFLFSLELKKNVFHLLKQ